MKYLKLFVCTIVMAATMSCGHTTQQDNTTQSPDTMVMKKNMTDSATNSISTDTTKR